MRKVILSVYMSLDGVIENPAWTAPYWGDDISTFQGADQEASDAMLMGRVTYELFAPVWPTMPEFERMNSLPKYVATRTLDTPTWNATFIKDNIPEEIARLKGQPGGNLLMYASSNFAHTLRQHNLIDEYHILVYPVVLGKGKRLFEEGLETTALKLVEAKPFKSGVVALIYTPADANATDEATIQGV